MRMFPIMKHSVSPYSHPKTAIQIGYTRRVPIAFKASQRRQIEAVINRFPRRLHSLREEGPESQRASMGEGVAVFEYRTVTKENSSIRLSGTAFFAVLKCL